MITSACVSVSRPGMRWPNVVGYLKGKSAVRSRASVVSEASILSASIFLDPRLFRLHVGFDEAMIRAYIRN